MKTHIMQSSKSNFSHRDRGNADNSEFENIVEQGNKGTGLGLRRGGMLPKFSKIYGFRIPYSYVGYGYPIPMG